MSGLKGLWNSKKALMALISAGLLGVCMYFDIDVQKAITAISPLLLYIFGQAGVDIAAMLKGLKK